MDGSEVMLTIGSLFSGIGGLELGLEWAGLGPTLWQCEKDPFCRSVLEKHWPAVTRYEDVTKLDGASVAPVGIVCGGFPCQDVSSAGSRKQPPNPASPSSNGRQSFCGTSRGASARAQRNSSLRPL